MLDLSTAASGEASLEDKDVSWQQHAGCFTGGEGGPPHANSAAHAEDEDHASLACEQYVFPRKRQCLSAFIQHRHPYSASDTGQVVWHKTGKFMWSIVIPGVAMQGLQMYYIVCRVASVVSEPNLETWIPCILHRLLMLYTASSRC